MNVKLCQDFLGFKKQIDEINSYIEFLRNNLEVRELTLYQLKDIQLEIKVVRKYKHDLFNQMPFKLDSDYQYIEIESKINNQNDNTN